MRIIDPAMLARFRGKRCELGPNTNSDPAHFRRRSRGRLDIAINLISLCRFDCHRGFDELGTITERQVLEVIARREGCAPGSILIALGIIDSVYKYATDEEIESALAESPPEAAQLVRRALKDRSDTPAKPARRWPKQKIRRGPVKPNRGMR